MSSEQLVEQFNLATNQFAALSSEDSLEEDTEGEEELFFDHLPEKGSKRKESPSTGVETEIHTPIMTRSQLKKQKNKSNSSKQKKKSNKKSKSRPKGLVKKKGL